MLWLTFWLTFDLASYDTHFVNRFQNWNRCNIFSRLFRRHNLSKETLAAAATPAAAAAAAAAVRAPQWRKAWRGCGGQVRPWTVQRWCSCSAAVPVLAWRKVERLERLRVTMHKNLKKILFKKFEKTLLTKIITWIKIEPSILKAQRKNNCSFLFS